MLRFQLPRIAKPSGTAATTGGTLLAQLVSTSPDSKAIRNHLFPCSSGVFRAIVSTSPDSKAIRNLALQCGQAGNGEIAFQLPRIAKPSGTRSHPLQGSRTQRFNFPG